MAPQTDIPVAANILGTIGTILWCVQLVPQIWRNWRTKETDGLPGIMMFLWAISGLPFGVYTIVQNFNIPLQVQPQIFMALTLVSWAQTLIYKRGWSTLKAAVVATLIAAFFAGTEAALIITLAPIYEDGNEAPMIVVGVISSILLALGLLPPYGEIWKRHGRVVGISFIFLTMDWFGAFFSLMALVAQNTFDILGGVTYMLCCFLEIGIFSSHVVWLFRSRRERKLADERGITFDDLMDEYRARGIPSRWADREDKCGRFWRKYCMRRQSMTSYSPSKEGENEPPSGGESEDMEKGLIRGQGLVRDPVSLIEPSSTRGG